MIRKKIDVLGVGVDNCNVCEAIQAVEQFMSSTVMNIVGIITIKMLVDAQEDEDFKDCLNGFDLLIPREKEILKSVNMYSSQYTCEITENQFFKEFMECIRRHNKKIYLLAETEEELQRLKKFLLKSYKEVEITGGIAVESCIGDSDHIVNEINGISADIVFSIFSSPKQEYFLRENKDKINAQIWYGMGNIYDRKKGVCHLKSMVERWIYRKIFKTRILK